MNKMKLYAGIIVFGSLWGFSECIIGSQISDAGLPSGAIMTGFFALTFLVMSRMFYRQPGMQLGMGLVAGGFRLFNPFVGCHICSALAIMAEGLIFELIWYKLSFDFKELKNLTIQTSMGIVTAYLVFVGGYIVTQVLTPVIAGSGFYLENLLVFMPRILSSGLLPALIGGFVLPTLLLAKKLDINLSFKDKIYYPITAGISAFCWIFVIGNWFLLS
jgi:hypothetical protein